MGSDEPLSGYGGGEVPTVWDFSGTGPAGTKPLQLDGHRANVSGLAFQHTGPVLASGGEDGAAIVREAAAIRQMAPFEVGLFKGCAYPGQGERGIVHRSPHPGKGMRRIKLIVDSTAPSV